MLSRCAMTSTVLGASDFGIEGYEAVSGFWMTTVPPAALTSRAPAAPSDPLPVRITAISRSPQARGARYATEVGVPQDTAGIRLWSTTAPPDPPGQSMPPTSTP